MRNNQLKNLFIKTLLLSTIVATTVTAQKMASVSATNVQASKPAAYIFEVVFDSEVRPDSRIDLTFPQAFNTEMVMMATSEKMDGNLTPTVKGNVVSLNRQNATTTIAAGDTIDIKLASVLNPNQIDKEWDFTFRLFNTSNAEMSKQTIRSRVEQFTKK